MHRNPLCRVALCIVRKVVRILLVHGFFTDIVAVCLNFVHSFDGFSMLLMVSILMWFDLRLFEALKLLSYNKCPI